MFLKGFPCKQAFLRALSISFIFALAGSSTLVSPVFAQNQKKSVQSTTPGKDIIKPLGAETSPYDKELYRLSELLGGLGYLHSLCTGTSPMQWSQKIQLLAESEGKMNQKRHDLVTGAYNKGFRNYALTYQACTYNAQVIIANYIIEAEKISKLLSSRYGG